MCSVVGECCRGALKYDGSQVNQAYHACVLQESSTLRHRHKELRTHPFFMLEGILKEGRDLVIRDSCGEYAPRYSVV